MNNFPYSLNDASGGQQQPSSRPPQLSFMDLAQIQPLSQTQLQQPFFPSLLKTPSESSFQDGEVVFCYPSSISEPWQAAMIVPSSEITPEICSEEIKPNEKLVRYFHDNTFAIKTSEEMSAFNQDSYHYKQFQENEKGDYLSASDTEKGIRRAITFLNSGYAPKEFKWPMWGASNTYRSEAVDPTQQKNKRNLVTKIPIKRAYSDSPPLKPVIDPFLSSQERAKIISKMKNLIKHAQQVYESLEMLIKNKVTSIPSVKTQVEASRALRVKLQTEIGDGILGGADLSLKRPMDNSESDSNTPNKRKRRKAK